MPKITDPEIMKLTSPAADDRMDMLWSLEDQAIFAGIISFYFGQRAMSKVRSGR